MEIIFYCPYVPMISVGELWVMKSYRSAEDYLHEEYLVKIRCSSTSQVREVLEEVFPAFLFGHDAPYYEFLSDLIIT